MFIPAAMTLQKREAENQDASQDRRFTVIGLWIAAIALGADVLLNLFGNK